MGNSTKGILSILVLLVLGVLAWGVLTMPDQRSTGQRIGDAIDALPHGVGKAADQLGDRTPGQKLGDAVKDTGQTIKDSTAQ
jgi:hypothetical protein